MPPGYKFPANMGPMPPKFADWVDPDATPLPMGSDGTPPKRVHSYARSRSPSPSDEDEADYPRAAPAAPAEPAEDVLDEGDDDEGHDFSKGEPYPGSWNSTSQLALLLMKAGNPWTTAKEAAAMMKGNPDALAEVRLAIRKKQGGKNVFTRNGNKFRFNTELAQTLFGSAVSDNTYGALKWMI